MREFSSGPSLPPELRSGRQAIEQGHYPEAERIFRAWLAAHPQTVPANTAMDAQAELGLGDAQLGLRQPEPAEASYRRATALDPRLWQAHKNLVIVEAELGRWEDFDGERAVLRSARERGEPGIDRRESDVIDRFTVLGGRWVVREYFEPVGRSEARYNFTRFSAQGRVEAYLSLEPVAAATAALQPGDVRIGAGHAEQSPRRPFALNWYTGRAHGVAVNYPAGEPAYERLRADAMRWLGNPAHRALLAAP